MPREIRITISDTGSIDVWEGDRHSEQLYFGEMIETIVDLCHPKLPGVARYAMLTDAEWKARWPKVTAEEFAEVEPAPERPPPAPGMERCSLCDEDYPTGAEDEHLTKCDGIPF